jgi:L-rhamnose isomerase
LPYFKVAAADRAYPFRERNALSVELRMATIFDEKLNYIHQNLVRAGIWKLAKEYKYFSALFYYTGKDNWGFLRHYRG